ncbi:MAG TPA: dihydroorotase, partial [Hydrogenophaga sp.]
AVELLLGLATKWAQQEGLGLMQALAVLTTGPQTVLGNSLGTLQHSVGQLSVGGQADVCLFDAGQDWRVEPGALRSQGKHTPFAAHALPARVRATLVGGHVAFEALSESV